MNLERVLVSPRAGASAYRIDGRGVSGGLVRVVLVMISLSMSAPIHSAIFLSLHKIPAMPPMVAFSEAAEPCIKVTGGATCRRRAIFFYSDSDITERITGDVDYAILTLPRMGQHLIWDL